MRENVLIGLAVFIAIAGAIITLLPVPRRLRRHRHRRELMKAFMYAWREGQLHAKFLREKEFMGKGFIDSFTGTAGVMPFCLTRRFRPFEQVDSYTIQLGHGADDGSGRECFHYRLKTSDAGAHVVTDIYFQLRERYPMPASKREVS